mmetsp:Transcript_117932/g.270534  ORF Transcript_117932/g.270534 Transcript_117932/m.270534 type:complete len:410 (+) Transcript_117932:288-1517(+)
MKSHMDLVVGSQAEQDFPEPLWAHYTLFGVAFAGTIAGMLVMGYVGDVVGTPTALCATNALVIAGALGCAMAGFGRQELVYGSLVVFRFVVGFGAGGIYPLSAVSAADSVDTEVMTESEIARTVGAAFFWQTPGSLSPYLIALALLQIPHFEDQTSFQFRAIFAVGVVPAAFVLLTTLANVQSGQAEAPARRVTRPTGVTPEHFKLLVGTGGTWLIYDVAFFGFVVFLPSVLQELFRDQTLTETCCQTIALCTLSCTGIILSITLVERLSTPLLSVIGFGLQTAAFVAVGAVASGDAPNATVLLVCLALLMVSLTFGPALTTFVIPTIVFPPDVRSTYHGFSAACGKVGALIGALLFPVVNDAAGTPAVMYVLALVSCLGGVLSVVTLGIAPLVHKLPAVPQYGAVPID